MREKHYPSEHKRLIADGKMSEIVIRNESHKLVTLRYKIKDNVLQARMIVNGEARYRVNLVEVESPVIAIDITQPVLRLNEIMEGINGYRVTDRVPNCPNRYSELTEKQFAELMVALHEIFEKEQVTHHRVYSITFKDRGIGKLYTQFR